MTRDQLFALPVGTQLDFIGYRVTVTSVDKKTMRFVDADGKATGLDWCLAGPIAEMMKVIPGELDASEVVE